MCMYTYGRNFLRGVFYSESEQNECNLPSFLAIGRGICEVVDGNLRMGELLWHDLSGVGVSLWKTQSAVSVSLSHLHAL